MESPANPLLLSLQSLPQTGALAASVPVQAAELKGENEFLAALQLVLGEPPPPALPVPTVPDTLPVLTENQVEPELDAVGLPAIFAAQITSDRQIITGELPPPGSSKLPTEPGSSKLPTEPGSSKLPTDIVLGQGAKPVSVPSIAPSIKGGETAEEIAPATVESKPDLLSANSLRLLGTAPASVSADLPGLSQDVVTKELPLTQITSLSSSGLGASEGQLVRTSVSTPIPQAPGQAGWDNALGQRVLWMTGQQVKEATIQLNPPELGKIEVRISVDGDKTSVSFISQHANVREAIDAALPRLREMLGADGLNLTDASVSDERQTSAERQSAERPDNRWIAEDDKPLSVAEILVAQEGIVTRGLVDTYV